MYSHPHTPAPPPRRAPRYINEIIPAVCKPGDDEQHGSSTLCDITALQAISKRIHLGKFVAETKFQVLGGERLARTDEAKPCVWRFWSAKVEDWWLTT
jgi:chorismate mutase